MTLGIDGPELNPDSAFENERRPKEGPSVFETLRSFMDSAATGSQNDTVQMIRRDMAVFNR